ncbi:MAG TPA: hypothetical protein PKV69_06810, partial [Candidatus Hydrogenedentes bacterium]|nr:hypothetical protein [Candidatus Hydrogenedentota bacterium]
MAVDVSDIAADDVERSVVFVELLHGSIKRGARVFSVCGQRDDRVHRKNRQGLRLLRDPAPTDPEKQKGGQSDRRFLNYLHFMTTF